MSEKQKDDFIKKAALTAGTGLALAGAITAAAGQVAQRAEAGDILASLAAEKGQKSAEYILSAQEVAKGMFTIEDVIGSFEVKEGHGLEDPALAVIEQSLGTEVFNETKPLFYDALRASIDLHGTVQPGETKTVVEADIDPEEKNGNEYLVVNPDQINHGIATELPTPIIADGSNGSPHPEG